VITWRAGTVFLIRQISFRCAALDDVRQFHRRLVRMPEEPPTLQF